MSQANLESLTHTYDEKHRPFLRESYKYGVYNSHDLRTSQGATLVVETNTGILVFSGTNHFPPSILNEITEPVNEYERRLRVNIFSKEHKNEYILHAEKDAIQNAKEAGVPLTRSILYSPDIPCYNCASEIKNAGIPVVVSHKQLLMRRSPEKIEEAIEQIMFLESSPAPVKLLLYDGKIGDVWGRYDSQNWFP